MDRIEQMKDFLKEMIEEILEKRIQFIAAAYEKDEKEKQKLIEALKEFMKGKKGFLYISYLRSSYIIENNQFQISFFQEKAFVEEDPESIYYNLKLPLKDIEGDIDYLNVQLRKQYIRISLGELEEIRRSYMEKLYQGLGEIFNLILKTNAKDNIPIYFGEYMGETIQIGEL